MDKLQLLKDQIKHIDDDVDMQQEYIDECADLDDEELQLELDSNGASYLEYKKFAQEVYSEPDGE